jgi:hypothetical protein
VSLPPHFGDPSTRRTSRRCRRDSGDCGHFCGHLYNCVNLVGSCRRRPSTDHGPAVVESPLCKRCGVPCPGCATAGCSPHTRDPGSRCSCLTQYTWGLVQGRPSSGPTNRFTQLYKCPQKCPQSPESRRHRRLVWRVEGSPKCGGRLTVSQVSSTPKPAPKSRRICTGSAARVASQLRSLKSSPRLEKNHPNTEIRPWGVVTCVGFGRIYPAHHLRPWVRQLWATPLGLHPYPYSHHHRQSEPIDSVNDNSKKL